MTALDDPRARPLDHVERPAPPWRRGPGLTECRLPVVNHPTITRAEFVQRVKTLGVQRAAFTLCMTCAQTADRHPTWESSPAGCINRETEGWHWRPADRVPPPIDAELLALAALAEAHRDEFEAFVLGLGETSDLTARRVAKRRRA